MWISYRSLRGESLPEVRWPAPREVRQGMLEVDVAHAGETWEHAREKIVAALDRGDLL
jgi:hypothetical protein